MELAMAMNLPLDEAMIFVSSAICHDIGKLIVDEKVLDKPGTLGEEEYIIVQNHPVWGADALSCMLPKHQASEEVCRIVLEHHERWDGKGYPAGLSESNIHPSARKLGVVDAYAAMVAPIEERPYNDPPKTHDQAISTLLECSGTQFDPKVVEVFAFLPPVTRISPLYTH